MFVGVQFTGQVAAGARHRWFTHSWPPAWNVLWSVVPITPGPGAPQVAWDVEVERASPTAITYWLTIRNLTDAPVTVEGRYAVFD